MPRPYELLDEVATDEGTLELRRRGERDFLILVGGRVLMTSALTTTELALAEHGCRAVSELPRPRILLGGLGLGYTLRAALDTLPRHALVVVAELNEKVVEWNRGPGAVANGQALADPRVRVFVGDVMGEVRRVATEARVPRYDAMLWDLYVGPKPTGGGRDPLYGNESLRSIAAALSETGVLGVWSETRSQAYEARLKKQGFTAQRIATGHGGVRHAVYLARKGTSRGKTSAPGARVRRQKKR